MSCKTCNVCKQDKSIDDFQKDNRNKSGYQNRCRSCRNACIRCTVKCPNCGESYTLATLRVHMKTKKCTEGEAEWKHPMPKNKRFKSNSDELVDCPCGHKACSGEVKEQTAYRHMRYGINHRPTHVLILPKHDNNSDSEQDL